MKNPAEIGGHPWRQWPANRRNVQELIRHAGLHQTEENVLTIGSRAYTGRQLVETAGRSAAFLRRHGVGPGDRVIVSSPNRSEMIDLFLGCVWSGAAFVPLNPALRGDLLRHQLRSADPAMVVFDETTGKNVHAASDVFDTEGPVRVVISTEPLDRFPQNAPALPPALKAIAVEFSLEDDPVEPAPVGPETTAAILFTSGTTGPSKGVIMPHGQFFWWSVICTEELQLTEDDVLYTCLPLFHTNALTTLLQALGAQGKAVIGQKFSVSAFWTRLVEAQATVTFTLGAMNTMLWNRRPAEGDHEASKLRLILGPGIEAAIKRDFEDHFRIQVVEGFGMTEIGVAFYTPVGQRTEGVLGIPHPDYEVALLDADGQPVAPGKVGELVIRPRQPFLMSNGYFDNPEATVASRRNLWFHTGDLVSADPDGMYRYFDRLKDSIRRRGENISSYEVESVFLEHPDIIAAAAIAVPSELGEDEVMVCLHVVEGQQPAPERLIDFAEPNLPPYALPRYLRLLPALPLTANGKISKQVLRDQGITTDTWERISMTG